MSDTLLTILILAAAAGVILGALLWNKSRRNGSAEDPIVRVYSDVIQYAPNGVRVASRYGKPDVFLETVNRVFNELFLDAAALGYAQWLAGPSYTVYVLDGCTPSPEQGVPSFRIRADNYDGGPFDQDPRPGIGYVLASEFVIQDAYGVPTGEYVICDSDAHRENNLRYGPEHIILYHNDRARYDATVVHSETSGHPLIPGRNPAKEGK